MKKVVSLLLVLMLICASVVFCACGNEDPTSTPNGGQTPVPSAETTESPAPTMGVGGEGSPIEVPWE